MQRIWTDGACKGNPGPGGWAWVSPEGRWANGAEAHSTNQRMEIMAAFDAVRSNEGPLTVVSDSTYVVNCFRDGWWKGWLQREWKNSQRKPVANRDLWEPFIELVRARGDVEFEWVKGHSGDEFNDIADRLAVAAADAQADDRGDVIPTDLGEEDVVDTPASRRAAARASGSGAGAEAAAGDGDRASDGESDTSADAVDRDRRLPAGRLLGVFGAKPTELGGYESNATADAVGRRLQGILAAKARMHPEFAVVSGLRLGAEMLGAESAIGEGIPLVVVLPFPDPDKKWPAKARRRFAHLLASADTVVTLEAKVPDTTAKVAGALKRRDAWLARNIDEAIVVWDGRERFTGQLLKTLQDRLGDDVWEEPIPS